MLNQYGLRSIQVQMSRGFRDQGGFSTRYWSPRTLLKDFTETIGPSALQIDGFFVQGRYEDRRLFKPHHRAIVEVSRALKGASRYLGFLTYLADNLFVVSRVGAKDGGSAKA